MGRVIDKWDFGFRTEDQSDQQTWWRLELSGAGGMKFRKRAKGESFKLFKPPVNEDVADTRDVYKKLMKDRINQGLWTVLTGAGLEQ